jgi:integrase
MKLDTLTQQVVDDAAPAKPGSSYYIMDGSLPGFALRVQPKSKTFVVRFRRKPYTIGPADVFTVAKARARARTLLLKLWSNEPLTAATSMTVADLFEQYVTATGGRKRALTNLNESRLWRIHILPALRGLPVSELTRERVGNWHRSRSETPASANRALSLLRTAVRWGESAGLVPPRSSDTVKADKFAEHPRERMLTAAELTRLGAALRQVEVAQLVAPELVAVVRLTLYTGARPSEILNAQAEWIDWERRAILLPSAKGDRSGRRKGRPIWFGTRSAEILRSRPDSGPLFPTLAARGDEDRAGYNRYERAWARICKLAGIKGATPYVTRHTFVSRGARAGVPLEGSSDLAGHQSIEITKRVYHHGEDATHQKNVLAMESSLDDALGEAEIDQPNGPN